MLTGKIGGRKGRDKPRKKILDGLTKWLGRGTPADSKLWRDMVTNFSRHGT